MLYHHLKLCYDDYMRTTVTIDEDVLDRTRSLAVKLRKPFKSVLNEVLRRGLDQIEQTAKKRAYTTEPHDMRLIQDRNIDNIQEFLAQIEGEDHL